MLYLQLANCLSFAIIIFHLGSFHCLAFLGPFVYFCSLVVVAVCVCLIPGCITLAACMFLLLVDNSVH